MYAYKLKDYSLYSYSKCAVHIAMAYKKYIIITYTTTKCRTYQYTNKIFIIWVKKFSTSFSHSHVPHTQSSHSRTPSHSENPQCPQCIHEGDISTHTPAQLNTR